MARTLFDLHRTITVVEINDGAGDPIRVGIKAPTHAIQTKLLTILNEAKAQAEIDAATNGLRDNFLTSAQTWPKENLIELILTIELGTVQQEADLAPNSGTEKDEALTDEQKQAAEEAEATQKRQERRRGILNEFAIEELCTIYADLNVKLACMLQATGKFTIAQLCAVIVDPEPPNAPMFSEDPEAANYFGHLQPETVDALSNARNQFFSDLSEKNLRRQAEAPDFSSSGKSAKKRRGSRGGIGSIPRISPRPLPASTAVESG